MTRVELMALVDKHTEHTIELRRDIHAHPELSEQEFRTRKVVCDELDRLGIPYQTWEDDNGVIGLIEGGGDGPVIALRADMDALPIQEGRTELPFCSQNPGVMHACGHDVHTTVQLGATAVLKELAPKLKGAVKLIFQPAEEAGTHGAAFLVKRGCMENPKVDKIFGIHVDDVREWGTLGTKAGAINAASDLFEVTVLGKSTHGTKPERGIDAMYVACQMVLAVYSMVARRLNGLDKVSVNVGKLNGGTAHNIVCDKAEFGISLRTVDNRVRAYMHEEIRALLEGIATANRATVEIKESYGCSSQFNDEECVELIHQVSDFLWGKDAYSTNPDPAMGSEDFSAYCESGTPGSMWELGVRNTERGWTAPLHNMMFCPDERAIPIGMAMQAGIVYQLLSEDGLKE